jgi:MSHA pilin protein MshB
MNRQGFTLVELIVVIVLIGLLAAVALSRFMGIDDQAHTARVETTIGVLRTSLQQARSIWMLQADDEAAENLQVFGVLQDGQIDFNASGWPSQQRFGSLEANPTTNNVADCISVARALINTTQIISNAADADYTPAYLGGGRCRYSYVADTTLSFEYNSNTGVVIANF